MMFRPGYNIDSLPKSTCTNTTSDRLKISANMTHGWLALNLVNAASVAKMSVSLDGHSMYVYAADGLFVDLQKVEVSSDLFMLEELYLTGSGSSNCHWSTLFYDDQA
jgi:L-ascorbate oxidase